MKGRTRIMALMLCALFLIAPFASFAVTAKTDSRMPSGDTSTRIVLGELYTALWCGPCLYADQAADSIMDQPAYFDSRWVLIEFHTSDKYTPADGSAGTRGSYYSVSGIPTMVIDGKDKIVGAGSAAAAETSYKQKIDARSTTSDVFLEIDSKITPGNPAKLDVWVNATLLKDTAKTSLKLLAVLVEDEDIIDPGSSKPIRMTAHALVINAGVQMSKKGDTGRATGSMNLNASWVVGDMAIVAFLQADSDKEVLQAGINYFTMNQSPTVTAQAPTISMAEDGTDTSIDLDTFFSDPESDPITFWSVKGSTNIQASVDGQHVVTITPKADWSGQESIVLQAADALNCPTEITVPVTVTAVNDPPTKIKDIAPVSMLEGATKSNVFNLNTYFADIDDQTFTFTASGAQHINTTIKSTGDVSFTSPVGWAGQDTITFTAKDSGGLTATAAVVVTVSDVNFPPKQLKAIPDITMNEDSVDKSIKLSDYFSDIDTPELTYTLGGLTNVVAVIGTDTVITISPKVDWNGLETVTLTTSDTVNKALTDTFTITVNAVNDAPTLTGTGFETPKIDEDKDYTTEKAVNSLFTDIDGPALTYSSDPGDNDLTITLNDDYTITYHPAANWNGEKTYWIKATDGQYTIQYNATVSVQAINDPPRIDTFAPANPSMTINEGEKIDFNIVASDIQNEGETLVYKWTSNSKDIGENAASYQFVTDSTSAGKYTLVVTVSDGELKDSHTWSVTVKNVNRKPTALITAPGASDTLKSNTPVTLSANGSDPDSDTLTYQWSIDGVSVGSGPSVTTMIAAGTHTVKVVVADPNGGSVEATTSITVTKVGGSTGGGGVGSSMLYIALAVVAAVIAVAGILALVMKGKKKAAPVPPTETAAQFPPPPPQTQPYDPGQATYGQYQEPQSPPPPQYGGYQGPPPQY